MTPKKKPANDLICDEDAAARSSRAIKGLDSRPIVVFEIVYRPTVDTGDPDEVFIARMTLTPEQYDPDEGLPLDADIDAVRLYLRNLVKETGLYDLLADWSLLHMPRALRVLPVEEG